MKRLLSDEEILEKTSHMDHDEAFDFLFAYIKETQDEEVAPEVAWAQRMAAKFDLTKAETIILQIMKSRSGRFVTAARVAEAYDVLSQNWRRDGVSDNLVKVYMSKIRSKLAKGDASFSLRNKNGFGYILDLCLRQNDV